MKQEEFELEVVTPMFISGPDTKKNELRAPSIKGVLRWWWRALNGHLTISDLKKNEEKIFGSTSQRSSFSIEVRETEKLRIGNDNLPSGPKVSVTSKGRTFPISLIDYLAFGIAEYDRIKKGNVYNRPYITVGSKFIVLVTFYNNKYSDEIIEAIHMWLKYGSLGSKSRNGFGCLKGNKTMNINKDFSSTQLAEYPSFSMSAKLFLFNKHNSWENALAEIGKFYREARLNLEPRHVFDKRVLVAKPIEVKGEISVRDRHSKTFFLHIEKIDNQFQGKILNLPYKYYQINNQNKYYDVNNKVCTFLEKNAREVKNVF